ncbi:MAG: NAD(P)-dependent oxidoreductase [Chlamydiia bacterium]|nr:NAD(P)-dependent oxidoreductase [Chlamydiia bacterium]
MISSDKFPILITGSEGLIGKKLAVYLRKKGYFVVGLDLRDPENPQDVRNASFPEVKGVIHLAAVSRVIWGEEDPEKCYRVNVEGTERLIKMYQQKTVKPWMIFGSSREVYGQQPKLPVQETVDLKPMNVYAKTKCLGESLFLNARSQGMNTSILRFSNVFGSKEDHKDRVIPKFCLAALKGEPMRIDGRDHIFDFTFVDDVVEGIFRLVEQLDQGRRCVDTMHFTTGQGTTLYELASLVNTLGKNQSQLNLAQPRSYDVATFIGDPLKAKEILGWQARTPLIKGLHFLMESFDENLKSHSRVSHPL